MGVRTEVSGAFTFRPAADHDSRKLFGDGDREPGIGLVVAMLKRGSNSLIQEYSSCSASTSLCTTVQSTLAAVLTIDRVRLSKEAGSAK